MNNLTTWIVFLTGVISLIVAIISLLKVLGVERRIKHFERKSLIIYSDKPFGRFWQNKEKQEWFQKVAFEKKTINWRWKKGEGWAVWGIDFKEKQDFSDWIYTHSLEFDIKGQRGGERPSGVILEGYSKEMDELWKDIKKAPRGVQVRFENFFSHNLPEGRITTDWQRVSIPLKDFTVFISSSLDEFVKENRLTKERYDQLCKSIDAKGMNWEEVAGIIFAADSDESEDTVYLANIEIHKIQ